jgi:TRAP-type C4-dicarboxylate transport system permease small subunit
LTEQPGRIDSVVGALRWLEGALLAALLTTMIGVAAFQVVARNLFDSGLLWGDGLVRVLVLWVTLVGAMVASRRDDHIRMDLLTKVLSERWVRPARRLTSAFTALVCGLFAYHSARFVWFDYQEGIIAFAGVPAWMCEAVLPVGAAVMAVRYLLHTLRPP